MSLSAITRYEAGRANPMLETARRLVAACGFDLRIELSDTSPQRQTAAEAALARSVSRTVCGPTTRSPLWRPNFAVSDPDAPPPDSESLVSLLDRHGVAYVLVGGLAAVAHGATRATFDIVPRWETDNLDALAGALRAANAHLRVPGTESRLDAPGPVR